MAVYTFSVHLLVVYLVVIGALADNQLDVSPEGRAACRGESITYTCIRTDTDTLRWRFDGASVGSFFLDGSIGVPLEQQIMGVEFILTLTEIDKEMVSSSTANITSTLMVTASPTLDGQNITCDAGVGTTETDLMINSNPPPTSTPTIASITQVGPNQVNVTINEPTVAPDCVTDYIIQYGSENVSTGGNSSVVIPDVEFCQQSTVNFTVTANLIDGVQTGSTSMELDLMGVGNVTGINITKDDIVPSSLAVIVNWNEPENGGGCTCISHYTIAIDGQEISTTGLCGDPQVVIPENEVGGRCIDHSLTITPVLQVGTSGESSRSDPVEFPFLFGSTTFPLPSPSASYICERKINVPLELNFDDLDSFGYSGANITVGFGLSESAIGNLTTRQSAETFNIMVDYVPYLDERIFIFVDFFFQECQNSVYINRTFDNIISGHRVFSSRVEATIRLTYTQCEPTLNEYRVMYKYYPNEDIGSAKNKSVPYPESDIKLMGLQENITYTYDVWVVNGDEMIGREVTGMFQTTDTDDEEESSGSSIAAIAGGAAVAGLVVLIAVVAITIVVIWLIIRNKKAGGAHISSESDGKSKDPEELRLRDRTSPDTADNLPTYADPHEIKREEFPGTEDVYTVPDKKKKTHKPEDHLPTYADPSAIEHETAPATGDLYTVVDKPKRSSRKQPPPPPEGALQTYAEVDVGKKQRGRELNYSDIQMTGTGDVPTRQPGVIYSDVAPHQHH